MLYSSPHNVYPDLNYFFAPFCIPEIIQRQKNQNCNAERNPNLNITFPIYNENNMTQYPIWPNQIMTILHPKTVKIKIINNEKEVEQSPQSKGVSHDKEELSKSKRIFLVSTNHDLNDSTLEYSIDNISPISNGEITKFNTDPKLKKIHSIYHLKRKIIEFKKIKKIVFGLKSNNLKKKHKILTNESWCYLSIIESKKSLDWEFKNENICKKWFYGLQNYLILNQKNYKIKSTTGFIIDKLKMKMNSNSKESFVQLILKKMNS